MEAFKGKRPCTLHGRGGVKAQGSRRETARYSLSSSNPDFSGSRVHTHARGLGPELRTLINRLAFERVRMQSGKDAKAMRAAAMLRLNAGESQDSLMDEIKRDLAALALTVNSVGGVV